MNTKVDQFIEKSNQWQLEYKKLRKLALATQLEENLKWGVPCYMMNGKNVLLIHGFKEYCAILFTKGALMKDHNQILIQQTENVQAARQLRFSSVEEIDELEKTIELYIAEAIEIEKSGLKVELKKETELIYPKEFQDMLDQNEKLKEAFNQLTPGRKRAYNLFFSAPKQEKTRITRIEKSIPNILDGKGLND